MILDSWCDWVLPSESKDIIEDEMKDDVKQEIKDEIKQEIKDERAQNYMYWRRFSILKFALFQAWFWSFINHYKQNPLFWNTNSISQLIDTYVHIFQFQWIYLLNLNVFKWVLYRVLVTTLFL